MKKKEIGQCRDCKWYKPHETDNQYYGYYDNCKQGIDNSKVNSLKNWGCWYWKEKKK